MSRLLLLFILLLWMWPRDNVTPLLPPRAAVAIFLGGYVVLLGFMRVWSTLLARRLADHSLRGALRRYNLASELARWAVPLWFAAAIFFLGWGKIVYGWVGSLDPAHSGDRGTTETYWRLPGMLIGTFPALLAWVGLWWAQYPADRALKEENVIYQADEGLPIHPPLSFLSLFVQNFRLQVLLFVFPLLLVVAARDGIVLGWMLSAGKPLSRDTADVFILPLLAGVFAFAPELIRRVIGTEPLPANYPLRRRLEALCRETGVRCRDILLWRTGHSMSNAMVMGIFPRYRYIFLSDLLLETMPDEEIEAVFAHEMGHIVHRHLWWYGIFAVAMMFLLGGPIDLVIQQIPHVSVQARMQSMAGAEMALFAVFFGFVSRRFERQADVYAARTIQAHHERHRGGGGGTAGGGAGAGGSGVWISHFNPQAQALGDMAASGMAAAAAVGTAEAEMIAPQPLPAVTLTTPAAASRSYVGEYGAAVVSGALERVARINNIPVAAREWLHGSIASRMHYLRELSGDAGRTHHFDKYMRRLYWALLAVLVAGGTWFGVGVATGSIALI
jgi:Zn-dependent protease with chaperone function